MENTTHNCSSVDFSLEDAKKDTTQELSLEQQAAVKEATKADEAINEKLPIKSPLRSNNPP